MHRALPRYRKYQVTPGKISLKQNIVATSLENLCSVIIQFVVNETVGSLKR